jgi:hypothetical protein
LYYYRSEINLHKCDAAPKVQEVNLHSQRSPQVIALFLAERSGALRRRQAAQKKMALIY